MSVPRVRTVCLRWKTGPIGPLCKEPDLLTSKVPLHSPIRVRSVQERSQSSPVGVVRSGVSYVLRSRVPWVGPPILPRPSFIFPEAPSSVPTPSTDS